MRNNVNYPYYFEGLNRDFMFAIVSSFLGFSTPPMYFGTFSSFGVSYLSLEVCK